MKVLVNNAALIYCRCTPFLAMSTHSRRPTFFVSTRTNISTRTTLCSSTPLIPLPPRPPRAVDFSLNSLNSGSPWRTRTSPAQKLAIAANFVLNTPPGQTANVMDDVRLLVGPSVLTADKEASLLARVNKERFTAVEVEGRKVLLTVHGEMPNGTFLDPKNSCSLDVDHKALTATKSAEPLAAAVQTALDGARGLREAVDREMSSYVSGFLPSAVVTTYGSEGNGIKVICCVSSQLADLNNYWAGAWRSSGRWRPRAAAWTLTGKVVVHVHYFEDGNVQLDDKAVFQKGCPAGADVVGAEFTKLVKASEQNFMAKLEDIYATMSDGVLQGLRRRLPVTRTKFDWDKLAVARLAGGLQRAAAIS